jgi:hypothetical protein
VKVLVGLSLYAKEKARFFPGSRIENTAFGLQSGHLSQVRLDL